MRIASVLDAEAHTRRDHSIHINAKLCDIMYQQVFLRTYGFGFGFQVQN
jgi:hypothetical protein